MRLQSSSKSRNVCRRKKTCRWRRTAGSTSRSLPLRLIQRSLHPRPPLHTDRSSLVIITNVHLFWILCFPRTSFIFKSSSLGVYGFCKKLVSDSADISFFFALSGCHEIKSTAVSGDREGWQEPWHYDTHCIVVAM